MCMHIVTGCFSTSDILRNVDLYRSDRKERAEGRKDKRRAKYQSPLNLDSRHLCRG